MIRNRPYSESVYNAVHHVHKDGEFGGMPLQCQYCNSFWQEQKLQKSHPDVEAIFGLTKVGSPWIRIHISCNLPITRTTGNTVP